MRNRFVAKSETGESLRPVFRKFGSGEQSLEELYKPGYDEVKGYTGSEVIIDRSGGQYSPIVNYDGRPLVYDDIEPFSGETIILAGKDYKQEKYPKSYKDTLNDLDDVGRKEDKRRYAEYERSKNRPVYSNPHDALTNVEKKAAIDKIVTEGSLTPGQNEALLKMRNRLSKRPQAIGSKWKGENYEHGPRIRQPKDFIFMKTVDYDEKYRKFEDGYRLPKDMPRGSKVVIGKLKGTNEWAVQSSLTPI